VDGRASVLSADDGSAEAGELARDTVGRFELVNGLHVAPPFLSRSFNLLSGVDGRKGPVLQDFFLKASDRLAPKLAKVLSGYFSICEAIDAIAREYQLSGEDMLGILARSFVCNAA